MRIGLLRHFPVTEGYPTGWLRAQELEAWRHRYERAAILPGGFDLGGVAWEACVTSPLDRARATASRVHAGEIMVLECLAEAGFQTFATGGLRLPVIAWRILMQVAWRTGHASQRASRDEFTQRVRRAADQLGAATRDTLVVSHAGMMVYLSRELRRRGFAGPRLGIADHARAYIYHSP